LQWKVKGIEINKKAADYAKNERELDVEIGSIFDFNFEPSSFDVIILDMVLEHIYNPEQAIKKISKWLKKDGQLIFSLPYFYGFEFSVFKEFSHSLHLPAHITFFNKNAIAHLLGRFSDINYVFHHFDRDIVASAEYKYQNNHNWVLKQIAKNKLLRWTIIKPLVFVMSLFKKTSRITVFATKN
jgi:2-polyprenyl-3-methyl-5-hydroxy-6-metoxy-1,4-benzoquinol methylase